ncbi:MAG TPA: tRNA-intron lyase [Thermoplasmatales archaeon]|nr:tRNA-intron lyase [Thermoplasmatales archaeon]
MLAKIDGENVIVENEKDANKIHTKWKYGKLVDDSTLKLDPAEALHLFESKKLVIESKEIQLGDIFDKFSAIDERFEQRSMIYKDLRKRGYRIDCFHELKEKGIDFHIKPKREDEREGFVVAINERETFYIREIRNWLDHIDPIIETLWLGVVDDEGDITYYSVERSIPKGTLNDVRGIKCKGMLIRNRVIIIDSEVAKEIFERGFYGKLVGNSLHLSLTEALYLTSIDVIDVYYKGNMLSFDELKEIALSLQPDIEKRYAVYKDLKERGLCVKTGYKFGSHFRAYERDPHKYHAEYLIDVIDTDFNSSWTNISRGIRLAHSVRKLYAMAVIDKGNIDYITIERVRP